LKSITDPPVVSGEVPQIPLEVGDNLEDDVGFDTPVDTPPELPISDPQETPEGTPVFLLLSSAPAPPTQSEIGTTPPYPTRECCKPDWYDCHQKVKTNNYHLLAVLPKLASGEV